MKKLLFFLMAILLTIHGLQSQTVTIGTGTTGIYSIPVNTFYKHSYSQQIYTATEIGAQVGVINSISYQYIYGTPQTKNPVTIYIGNTTKTSFTSTTDWVPVSSMSQVFTGSVTFNNSGTNNWINIDFDTPFIWDGTSNIVVSILNNNGAYTTSSNLTFNTHTNSDYKTLHYSVDGTTLINPITGSYTGTRIYGRNNIQLEFIPTPTCAKPFPLTFSNIMPNSVDVSWIENGTATQWVVEYKLTSDADWTNAISTTVNNANTLISGLSANTLYDLRVKSVCGAGDESFWKTGSIRTACDLINTLPFSETFDVYGTGTATYPLCWYKLTSNTYPYINTTYSSAPGAMYMYTASGEYNYVISPEFDATIPINTLSVFFKLYKGIAAYNVTVGVMSDPTNISTFDSIINLTPSAATTWQTFSVNFANYTGNGHHIAFKVQGFGAVNSMYIDDLTIMTTPSCNIPTGLTRTASTYNSMTLDWSGTDDANCAGWIVEYKPYDDLVWQSEYTTSHPFTISNLISNVVYRIRVKAVCVTGDTTYTTDIVNYGLPCEPISYFPWEEGFENVWFTGNGFGGTTDNRPWCWYNVNGGASTTYKWQRTTTATYVRSGLSSLQMYAAGTTGQLGDWIITPAFTFTGNERVKFWAKGYSTSYTELLNVKIFDVTTNGIFDAAVDTSLFFTIMPNTIIPSTDWTEYEINLSQFVGDYQIAFVRNTTGGYYLNIDDLSISEIPTCLRPTNVTLNYITDTEAQLSWIPGNSSDAAWWFYYKPSSATTYDSVYVTQTSYLLQNLSMNTTYSVYLRTDCGNELSEPTSPKSIKTATCAAIATIPWSDSFDTYTTGSTIFPTCWTNKSTSTSYPYVSTTYNTSPGAMYFYATSGYNLALTPSISSTIPMNTLRANFKLKMSTASYNISVGLMSDPNDLSTFYELDNITPSALNQWNDYEVSFASYTGQGTYIAFKVTYTGTTMTIYMDDLVISEIPSCAKPTQLAASNLTTTSADISWLPGNLTDASWWLYWKPTSASIFDSLLISSNPYTLPNLNSNTYYQVYLKTECGSDLSQPSDVLTFKTPCEAVTTIPYYENFDTYGTTAGTFPSCWFRPVLSGTTPFPSIVSANTVSSPASLKFQSASATQPTYAITPQLDVDINALRVLFKLKAESITSSGTIQVGVMSDPNNLTTFELVQTITPTSTNYTNYEVFFNNTTLTGTGKYIAFKHLTSSSSYYYWLDDFVVDYIPSCAKPIQLAAHDSTQTSVEISWLPFNIGDAAWWLYYKPTAATTFDSVYVTSSPYTLSNLNPSTIYEYYMRTDCGTELSEPTNLYNFNTQCGNIVSLPFADNFDSYATGTSVMPICWTRLNTYSDPRPYVNTGGRTGNCLYFYAGTAGTYNIAIMPNMDPSIAINNLRIRFYAKYYSSTDRIIVGFMSDPTLATTFVPVDTVYPQTSTWLPYEVYTDTYTGTGTYLALKNEYTSTYGYFYVDDLQIDYIPTCLKPTQIAASNITLNSADISWTPGNATDNAWWIYWKPAFGTTLDSVHVTAMPYQLTGLQSSTIYNVYIKTDCGNDLSELSTVFNFSTLCGTITQLPYTESFDYYGTTTGVFPNCWFRPVLNTITPFPSIVSGTSVSSPGSLKFQSASATLPTYAVTPELDVDINTLRVLFNLKAESTTSSGTIHVGVMSDPLDTNTFELVQVITPTSTVYTNYEVWFDNTTLTGIGNHIVFKHVTNAFNYYYWLDDVVIDLIPACAKPTQLAATNVTTSSAVINWVPGHTTDASWWIYWKQASATTFDSLLISSNPYTLQSLLTNTYYQVYLKTDCGIEVSQSSNILNFKTPCDAIATIPYTENFDSYGITAGTFPSCWVRPVLNTTTPFPSIVDAYSVSTPASLKFQSASATQPTYAITPQFNVNINTLKVNFKLKAESTTLSGTMQVGVMSDPNNLATFEVVETITPASTNFTNYEVMFTNTTLTGTGNYIAFKHVTSSSVYYYWLDDVIVDLAPLCVKPTQLTASNITTSSANISWTSGYATDNSWWVYWKQASATTYDSVLVNTNPYILTGLIPATTYQLYMKTDCGTQLSDPSNTISFTTACLPITTVPYNEYFDTYTTGTAAYPTCWSKLTSNATYPYIATTNFSTPGSLYLYSSATGGYCHAITPMFGIPINTLKAEFKLRVSATDDTLYVGVMTDPTDQSTFVLVQKLIPSAITTWQNMEVFFNNYTGTGQYIAFKNVYTTTTTTIYVDNLEIFTIPTCPRPTNLIANNSTSSSTTLSWTPSGTETSWNIEYGPIGFTPGSGTSIQTSSNPFTLNGLTHSTCYDFYVQAVCSPSDLSLWSNKGSFCTAQIPVNVPFNIDFETPSGVQIANNATGNRWFIGTDTANTVNNTLGGQNALYVSNDNGSTNAYTLTSASVVWAYRDVYFTPSTADYTLSFNWKGNGEGASPYFYDYLSVYIGTPIIPIPSTSSTITAPVGSDTLVTKLRLQPTWQTATLTLPVATYSGQTKRIYFMWTNDGTLGTQPPAAVDNISITSTGISTCLTPSNLTSSSITATSAQISWTAGGTETAWELDYKLASASTWTTIPVATNPTHLLTILTPVTNYEVRVRAVCGATNLSLYSPTHPFTTTATPCDAPTGLQVINITDQSALATWNAGAAISWRVEYKLVSSANWTSATTSTPSFAMAGLQSSSNYEVRVKAICTSNESAFTANVPFTTLTSTVTYTITATASTFGTITPSGAVSVNSGANQLFTFTPDGGYYVDAVVVDGVPVTPAETTYEFMNVLANHTISVEFLPFGIEENQLALLVELFPNPTTSIIELRLKAEDLHIKECKVFDMYGKLMRVIPIHAETTSIDVTDFASGVYFVRMDSERGTISKKFVKK